MSHNPGDAPLFADPKRLLLDMAQEHAVPALLRLIVTRLSGSHRVALARIWLTRPTADCSGCATAEACAAQTGLGRYWLRVGSEGSPSAGGDRKRAGDSTRVCARCLRFNDCRFQVLSPFGGNSHDGADHAAVHPQRRAVGG